MRLAVIAVLVCLSVVGLSVADPSVAKTNEASLNIPPQELRLSLVAFSKASGLRVLFISEDVDAHRATGVVGQFTPDEALRLLLKGTGLTFRYLDDKTITIVPAQPPGATSSSSSSGSAGGIGDRGGSGDVGSRVLLAQSGRHRM